MVRLVLPALALLVLAISSAAHAEKLSAEEEQYRESYRLKRRAEVFKPVKGFASASVSIDLGDLEKSTRISESELVDFVNLRVKNSFATVPMVAGPVTAGLKFSEVATVSCDVSCAGETDYPVAVHVACRLKILADSSHVVQATTMFVSSRDQAARQLRQSIEESISDLAISFYKARGEL